MRLVKQLGAVAAVAFVGGQVVAAQRGSPQLTGAVGAAVAVLALLVYVWVVRRTEHRPVTEVAPSGIVTGFVPGALLGVGLFSAVIAVIALLGGYHVAGVGSMGGAVPVVGFMAAAAVTEELLFRGVLLRIIQERTGTWVALVLSGVLFGLMHLLNPHATVGSAMAIAVEAGGMLGAAYVATRGLWVPIGLHFGWNVAEAGIFGTAVSGKTGLAGLVQGAVSGPSLLSGGDFGPEASLPALVLSVLVTLAFLRSAHRRGHLIPRRSRRAVPVDAAATLTR